MMLDDVLSGLDAITEREIIIRLLGDDGILKKSKATTILVTHSGL